MRLHDDVILGDALAALTSASTSRCWHAARSGPRSRRRSSHSCGRRLREPRRRSPSGSGERSPCSEELAKLQAFLRRDFLTAWSYRVASLSPTSSTSSSRPSPSLASSGSIVDEAVLPSYGGQPTSYLEFALSARDCAQHVHRAGSEPGGARRAQRAAEGTLGVRADDPDFAGHRPVRLRRLRPRLRPDPHRRFPLLVARIFDADFHLAGARPRSYCCSPSSGYWGFGGAAAG